MTVWIVITVLTMATLAALVLPVLYRPVSLRPRADHDLQVFRDQLAEVDRDIELGVLSAEQGEAVRLEVRRRMLAAAAVRDDASPAGRTYHKAVVVVVAVFVPVASLGLYGALGSPEIPDQPYAVAQAARMGGGYDTAAIQSMVDKLAERLKANPGDAGGWLMLGRSYRTLGRNDDAVAAMRKAVALEAGSAEAWSMLGEAITAANEGMVVPEARGALLNAVRLDRQETRARFYLGLARAQIDDARGAIAVWKDLEAGSPADAPWLPQLRKMMAEVAAASGVVPSTVEARGELELTGTAANSATPTPASAPSPGPSPAPHSAAAGPTAHGSGGANEEEAVRQRVENLAARLEKTPGDAAGWAMLGRSYATLGERTKSQQAYLKAMTLSPRDVGMRLSYAETLLSGDGPDDILPGPFVAVMREVLTIDQDQADALYYVGLAEVQAGRGADARAYWQRLLASLPKGSAEYQQLEQEIQSLK
ncbi:MAG: c-type cytochrome biogenesis protein CcmI [Alphaproteobacteria bacterium]